MDGVRLNITLVGVGGQGIGLLSETLLRAFDHAGLPVKGVDTHGLAQRGGLVVSHLRVGSPGGSPLIEPGRTDLLLALERTEALRGMENQLRRGGTCVYYDADRQSLPVRQGKAAAVTLADLKSRAREREISLIRVHRSDLPDPRMQNIALLGGALTAQVLTGLRRRHIETALEDLMEGPLAEKNKALLDPPR